MIDRAKLRARLARKKAGVEWGIRPSAAFRSEYTRQLLTVVADVTSVVRESIDEMSKAGLFRDAELPLFEELFERRVGSRLNALAEHIANTMTGKADRLHGDTFNLLVKNAIGVDVKKLAGDKRTRVGRVVQERTSANVDLIKSLAGEYKTEAREVIEQHLLQSRGEDLKARLLEITKKTEATEQKARNRAKLIARDQTQKMFSELNEARQRDLGVTEYRWMGINDGRERDSHVANNGKIFRYDSPPPETGNPGDDVDCRCVAVPILESIFD